MAKLFSEVGDTIPLHFAARHHAYMVRANQRREDITVAEMRWNLLVYTLHRLNVDWLPPSGQGKKRPAHSVVIPRARVCGVCGVSFFGPKRGVHCAAGGDDATKSHGGFTAVPIAAPARHQADHPGGTDGGDARVLGRPRRHDPQRPKVSPFGNWTPDFLSAPVVPQAARKPVLDHP